MKIREILSEGPTDVVARLYKEAPGHCDAKYNTDAAKYASKNSEYYNQHFKEWRETGHTPVFSKPLKADPHPFNNQPRSDREPSPGYRGLQRAMAASGQEYDRDRARPVNDPTRALRRDSELGGIGSMGF